MNFKRARVRATVAQSATARAFFFSLQRRQAARVLARAVALVSAAAGQSTSMRQAWWRRWTAVVPALLCAPSRATLHTSSLAASHAAAVGLSQGARRAPSPRIVGCVAIVGR